MLLKDQTAVITGAANGIGKAVSQLFAREGAVIVAADIDDDALTSLKKTIEEERGRCIPVHCDVMNYSEVECLMETAVAVKGGIDILVNNAGGAHVATKGTFFQYSEIDITNTLGINLLGVLFCCRLAGSYMREKGRGKIISMSSIGGIHGTRGVVYPAAKGGIIAMTKGLALDLAEFGITVNCISPGAIATREGPAKLPTRLGRPGTADEVANLVLFLASKTGDFITGSNYIIDGGRSIGSMGD